MDFGIPKEIRPQEFRVGLTPGGVFALVSEGHRVYVETGAGAGAGFSDEDYRKVGAAVAYSAEEVYGRAKVIAKIARLSDREYEYLQEGQTILSFLHLAVASKDLSEALQQAKITAVAYELIRNRHGVMTVLHATSQVAGRMAPIIAGQYLESQHGGRGILLSGVPGVPAAEVVILGAGVVGTNAAQAFARMGAHVTVMDREITRLEAVEAHVGPHVVTMMATDYNLARALRYADVVVGAVLVPGQRTPVLLTRELMRQMRPRAVFIDFSIDQGGCAETSRPTNHLNPTYIEEGIIHYAVPNVPARVPRTASHAITNAAITYLLDIGSYGVTRALDERPGLRAGAKILNGVLQTGEGGA